MEEGAEVILEIEGEQLKCVKSTLIENSDYFRIMFQGNFVERDRSFIKLNDVDYKSLNIILKLLADSEYIVEEEDLLLVLHTACMLQFSVILAVCVDRLTELLSLENCLKIWHVCESLDLKPLYLKAKNLSLMEFESIKDTDCIFELNIKQLHAYLANIFLHVKNELHVFTTCMRWWYENSAKEEFTMNIRDPSELFYYFLTFLDFNALSDLDVKEILTYPDIVTNQEIVKILSDVLRIREGDCCNRDEDLSKAKTLLNCRRRSKNSYPCMLIDVGPSKYVLDYPTGFREKKSDNNVKIVLLLDTATYNFKKLITLPREKHKRLEGFHILGYKELIFLFGGEFYMGKGNWSDNFWVYDTIRNRWERKTKMPHGRRHFESCIANDIVYIVGGTGSYRVIQDNMFFYNYKLDDWSRLIQLPCTSRQLKCCEYKDQLLLLNANNKCAYLFNPSMYNWVELKICDKKKLIASFPEKFVVFSHENFIYIKGTTFSGSSIIKLVVNDGKLEVVSTDFIKTLDYDVIESTMCGRCIYTIYKKSTRYSNTIIFEEFDLAKCTNKVVVEYDNEATTEVNLCGELCRFNRDTKLFNLSHFDMVEGDKYLTDFVL